ncbi:hypothetical protein ASE63_22855 [Bosea sp. Root381]|nr:hypothetical protein ASE63_22855 [Bosea sp. Root381]
MDGFQGASERRFLQAAKKSCLHLAIEILPAQRFYKQHFQHPVNDQLRTWRVGCALLREQFNQPAEPRRATIRCRNEYQLRQQSHEERVVDRLKREAASQGNEVRLSIALAVPNSFAAGGNGIT